jgi:6-hydroxycyclohex-1-ene-1-carbonyl-CoA dehydrogenase
MEIRGIGISGSAHRWLIAGVGSPMIDEPMPLPVPAAGAVTVAVAGCGVCHTDLGYVYDGVRTNKPFPLTLGHEISGRVVAAGPGAEAWLGRTVIVPAVIPCGTCDVCRRGKSTICPNQVMPGNDIDGGFATHVSVPATGLCPVDEERLARVGLSLADVAVVADAVTTPYQAVVQAGVGPGTLCVVVGAGGVGGYCVQIAAALGGTVVALDIDARKLDAVAGYGAAVTIDLRATDPKTLKKTIASAAAERGFAAREWAIFECSGTAAGQLTAYSLLVHGATLAVVGFTLAKVELRLSNLMAYHARALGNWGCPPHLYPAALELVYDGRIALAPFVEQHPLARINDVFAAVHDRLVERRPVLVPEIFA